MLKIVSYLKQQQEYSKMPYDLNLHCIKNYAFYMKI